MIYFPYRSAVRNQSQTRLTTKTDLLLVGCLQRKEAFDITPYPCIGQFKFLALTLLSHPKYPVLLERLKNGQTFIDMGCCFAQDM